MKAGAYRGVRKKCKFLQTVNKHRESVGERKREKERERREREARERSSTVKVEKGNRKSKTEAKGAAESGEK